MGWDRDHRDAIPLQVKRAGRSSRRRVELYRYSLRIYHHPSMSRDMLPSDPVVARTPARRPRLPTDLDVSMAPGFHAYQYEYHESFEDTLILFFKGESPVKGFGQTALF
ncbi:hypothetical protein SEVIR_5G321700v4 [Setaria viridis]|uniref:Uncharacterized protein n=2 Tax=Setaria TaxID=4554 RepID=A0A368RBA2_SETIT|nr:hypothetical protein SETIT_5G318500v2 [Setaria italica]TKW16775.1 hypothetical protein SEVIR_5G321700v2 [Setaria viridis]